MLSIVSSHTCKLLYNRITYHMSLLMKTLTHLHIQSFLPMPGFEPTRPMHLRSMVQRATYSATTMRAATPFILGGKPNPSKSRATISCTFYQSIYKSVYLTQWPHNYPMDLDSIQLITGNQMVTAMLC